MKKVLIIIIILMVCMVPVSARAGGGGSGGSGSGGGSSHTHSSGKQTVGGTVGSFIGVGMFWGSLYIIKHRHIFLMKKETQKKLEVARVQDDFWDEKHLLSMVKDSYFMIQKAWSEKDLETLKTYLSDRLYQQWEIKLQWQDYRHEANVLDHIRLISKHIVDIYDDEDNSKDYFWVAIEGKMKDEIIVDHKVISSSHDVFIEYWKFIRADHHILLDEIQQDGEL